jgi:MYXO-CTERM domain-containing protein
MTCNEAGKLGQCVQAKVGTDPKGDCMGDPICGPTCDSTGYCYENAPDGTKSGLSATDGGTSSFCSAYACSFGSCEATTFNCGLTCTTKVSCDETSKSCTPDVSGIKPGSCVIDNKCWLYGDINPANAMQICDPPTSKTSWSDVVDGGIEDTGIEDTGSDDTGSDDTGSVVDTGADTGAVEDTGSAEDASADVATTAGDLPEGAACSCDVPGKSSSSPLAALGVALGLALVANRRRRREERMKKPPGFALGGFFVFVPS